MDKKVAVEIRGMEEAVKLINSTADNAVKGAMNGITKATLYTEGEVKQSIAGARAETKSVKTGRFLQSVTSDVQGATGIIYSDVEYAKHLEYGTAKIHPRNHFRNSLTRSREKILEYIKADVKAETK